MGYCTLTLLGNFLEERLILEWCVVMYESKNGHQKDVCSTKIGYVLKIC